MSFSLSIALSSTSAKIRPPDGSFPIPPSGLYGEQDHAKERRQTRRRSGILGKCVDDPYHAEYHRMAEGRARERCRNLKQSGDDPHLLDLRRMMEGHHLGTYKSPKDSPRRRESRRNHQMRRSRELSQPKNTKYVKN